MRPLLRTGALLGEGIAESHRRAGEGPEVWRRHVVANVFSHGGNHGIRESFAVAQPFFRLML